MIMAHIRVLLIFSLFILIFLCQPVISEFCSDYPTELCIQKCCPPGHLILRATNRTCLKFDHKKLPKWSDQIPEVTSEFRIVYGFPQETSLCDVLYYLDRSDDVKILPNGSIIESDGIIHNTSEYCSDGSVASKGNINFIVCLDKFTEPSVDVKGEFDRIGLLISVPFLLATVIVYCLIPELQNVHGLCLICQVSTLFVAYLFLAMTKFDFLDGHIGCDITAYVIQFSFLATFFWLNIMCFDIFWAFSGLRPLRGSARERDRKKFALYSIYSWGGPILILIITLIMDYANVLDEKNPYKPNAGVMRCLFKEAEASWLYLYGPMAILIGINIILFAITATKIYFYSKDTEVLTQGDSQRHDKNSKDKERFKLYLKLFLVMGVNWVFEIMSVIFEKYQFMIYFSYVTDVMNSLQGVFIFFIFVWKERVRRLLIQRFCSSRFSGKRRGTSNSTVTTNTTISTTGNQQKHGVNKKNEKTSEDNIRLKAINEYADNDDNV